MKFGGRRCVAFSACSRPGSRVAAQPAPLIKKGECLWTTIFAPTMETDACFMCYLYKSNVLHIYTNCCLFLTFIRPFNGAYMLHCCRIVLVRCAARGTSFMTKFESPSSDRFICIRRSTHKGQGHPVASAGYLQPKEEAPRPRHHRSAGAVLRPLASISKVRCFACCGFPRISLQAAWPFAPLAGEYADVVFSSPI